MSDHEGNTPSQDLEGENLQLKRQMSILEREQDKSKAFLEQKIELLESQIKEFQEREESMKKINHTIMEALEDMSNKTEKNGLMVRAAEELGRASQQYEQAILELKKRSKEDLAKLEAENKGLKENLMEKEFEIKSLKTLLEEIKSGYLSARDVVYMSGAPSFANEGGETNRRRMSSASNTFPEDKEAWNRFAKVEKDLENIRLEVKKHSMKLSEDTSDSKRLSRLGSQPKCCDMYYNEDREANYMIQEEDESLYDKNGTLKPAVKELNSQHRIVIDDCLNTDQTTNPDTVFQNYLMTPDLPRDGQRLSKKLSSESGATTFIDGRPQKPSHMFTNSTLSTNSDFLKGDLELINNKSVSNKTAVNHNRKDWIYEEISLKKHSGSEGILKAKNTCMDQSFCNKKIVSRIPIPIPTESQLDDDYNVMRPQVYHQPNRMYETEKDNENSKLQNYIETSRGNYGSKDMGNDQFYPRKERENMQQTPPLKMFNPVHDERNLPDRSVATARKLLASGRQDKENANTEIRYMLGRLLKVKTKLEKQNMELNHRTFNYSQLDNLYNELDQEIEDDTRESPFLDPEEQQRIYERMASTPTPSNHLHQRIRSGNVFIMDRRAGSIANVDYLPQQYVPGQRMPGMRLERSFR